MKEIENICLSGLTFAVEPEVSRLIFNYLDDLRLRFNAEEYEIVADIESRIAELLSIKVGSSMKVVTVDMMVDVMNQIGSPEDFGSVKDEARGRGRWWRKYGAGWNEQPRLVRPLQGRVLGGVCAAFANYYGIPLQRVRLVALLGLFFTAGFYFYIIMWIVIPSEKIEFHI